MVKGILKCYSSPHFQSTREGPNDATLKPKRVSFDGAEPARVFQADEWDRSPAAVTLKLTYRDVVELKELNISLVNPSPLAMVRTPSRRPTKQRTPRSPSSDSSSSSSDTSQSPASPSPSFVPGRYLGPLLEDPASPSPTPRPKLPDSPPGLPAPLLKAIHSPTLPPPSPLVLSPPLSASRPPSPKPTSMVSSVPLYRHPRHSARTPLHRATLSTISDNAPMEKSIVLPSLAKASSFEFNELKMKLDKLTIEDDDEEDEDKDNQQEWKSLGLVSEVAEDGSGVAPTPPPTPRKPARTLMGMWDFKRSSMGFGRAKKV